MEQKQSGEPRQYKNIGKTSSKLSKAIKQIKPDKTYIFVDGRYHLQAERECCPNGVEVIRLGTAGALEPKEFIKKNYSGKTIGLDARRTSIEFATKLSEEGIKINLGDGKFYPISQEDFSSIFTNDLAGEPLNMAVGKEISSGNWSVLQRTYFDAIEKAQLNWYYDRKKNLCLLNSDFIKTVEVIQLFGLYFYKETKHEFIAQNEEHIVDALAYLEKSKNINTFKTKSLVLMLKSIDDVKAQQYINYVLGRKESKEIAEVGLYFLKNGLELGWDEGAVLQFKKFADISMISRIYELNPKLDYSIEELLNIDDSVLSKKHLKEKQEYITVRENMMKEIKLMLGDMDVSPVREKSKSLPKDSVVNSVKEFYNNMKAHNKIDYASLSTEELTKKYQYIKSMYEGNYKKVLARIEKMENK